MIVGERWRNTRGLRYDVIPLTGYDHSQVQMPEGWPSSGLKTIQALRAYPSLALFEPTIISVGKGTDYPYTQFGLPDERIGNHTFVPRARWPGHHPMYENQTCYGHEFYSLKAEEVPRFTTDIFVQTLRAVKKRPFVTDIPFFRLLIGDNQVVDDIFKGRPYAQIRTRFQADLEAFKRASARYRLYP